MPSDYLDYENNLAFPPQEIKSQDDLSEQGRQSEVLITAIERCEKLEKEIIALNKEYNAEYHRANELEDSLQTSWRNESKLKELLRECREFFEEENPNDFTVMSERMNELLTKIDNAIGEKK